MPRGLKNRTINNFPCINAVVSTGTSPTCTKVTSLSGSSPNFVQEQTRRPVGDGPKTRNAQTLSSKISRRSDFGFDHQTIKRPAKKTRDHHNVGTLHPGGREQSRGVNTHLDFSREQRRLSQRRLKIKNLGIDAVFSNSFPLRSPITWRY